MLDLYIQNESNLPHVPTQQQFESWVDAALLKDFKQLEQLIRVVSKEEIQSLNKDYRNKDKVTNILSFPAEQFDFLEYDCLGDLIVCADVVEREAQQQNKQPHDHWAHLIVHGMLHLQGYDHVQSDEAEAMESLEIKFLKTMGISNPYNTDMLTNKSVE